MRMIDADALKECFPVPSDDMSKETCNHLLGLYAALDFAPTIDAAPVVRCKDCVHYTFADNRAFGFPVKRCEWTGFEDVDDNDFCSRGERKTDGR